MYDKITVANTVTDADRIIFYIIIIGAITLVVALITAVLKIHTIEKEIKELIIQNDHANDTKIEQLAKIEKYLEVIAETELHEIKN